MKIKFTKQRLFLVILAILLIGEINFSMAQSQRINGKVTDKSGEGLPGVNILLKGTTYGTITDINGNYQLESANQGDTLVFSFIGFITQQVPINNRTTIDLVMTEDIVSLEQVVVIGYGEQKKSDLTGAVERLDADKFKHQSVTQLSEMMTGTIAGFNANQGASAAGGTSMEIRGKTSLTANTDPMVVLDGVIYNGSLRDINPNDIATIDILKDASSAAVFGAKAASGVILITTKKGSSGKPTINFSTKIGIAEATKDRKPLNAEQFLKFRADYFREGAIGNPSIPEHFYTDPNKLPDDISVEEWRNYSSNPNADPETEYYQRLNLYPTEQENALAGKTTDWYPQVMTEGLRQSYDLSIGGGTDNVKYYWSIGYLDNEGIIKGDKYSAIRSRLNVDFTVTDWLSVGANTQFSERDESSVPASLGLMYIASPFGNIYNEDGSLNLRPHDDPSAYNPLMNYFGQDRNRKINTFFASFYANVELPLGIQYKLSFQPRYSFTNEHNFWGEQTITGSQTYPGGRATRANSKVTEWMVDNLLTWKKKVGVHNFDVTFLYNAEKYNSWYEFQANQNFSPNPNLGYHGLQFGDSPSLTNTDMKQTGDALMGRINYTLLDKYLVTASLRRDGYSAFGQENPRALFPAAAFAWKVSDEDFFNENWLVNRLKLRVSWGVNGNRDIGAYSALAQLGSVLDYDGSNIQVGVQNTTLSNRGLTWERTESVNFGANIGLFENRVDLTADYYIGTTTNLLMNRLLPRITGFRSITSNLGELENRGFELTLNTVNINSNGFKWNTNFVFSVNRNKIKKLFGDTGEYTLLGETRTGELPDFSNHWFPGRSIDVVWDYDVIGVWQMEEEEQADVYNMSPGDFKAVDVNEDGQYTDLIDKQFIGYTTPRQRLGMRNEFSYKNFTAAIFIRADLGHLIPFNQALQGSLSHDRRNYNGGPMPYWTPENRNNEYARLRPIHSAYGGGLNIYKPGSFVRIQDVSLSYALPASIIERLELNSLSVFGAIRNLYSFDEWPGWDPESRMTPMPRIYTLGLNMSL
jgi:TonB-linked SusC/RagA family outer membrane protein